MGSGRKSGIGIRKAVGLCILLLLSGILPSFLGALALLIFSMRTLGRFNPEHFHLLLTANFNALLLLQYAGTLLFTALVLLFTGGGIPSRPFRSFRRVDTSRLIALSGLSLVGAQIIFEWSRYAVLVASQYPGLPKFLVTVLTWNAGGSPNSFFLMLLGAGVLAPVVEEIFFRGILGVALVKKYGQWKGVILTSALFAVSHLTIARVPYAFFMGVLLHVLFLRTGSLWSSILSHAVSNTLCVLMLYGAGGILESGSFFHSVPGVIVGILYFAMALPTIYRLSQSLRKARKAPSVEKAGAPALATASKG